MPSEQQSSTTPLDERDEWRTPPYVFEWACKRWGVCDVDLAASFSNTLCPNYLTADDDALTTPWKHLGELGWCNPPYSLTKEFVARAIEQRDDLYSVMLLPSPRGNRYDVHLNAATEIIFIAGRLAFLNPAGREIKGNTHGSMLVYFGPARYGVSCSFIYRSDLK